jgi:hypothetical protein
MSVTWPPRVHSGPAPGTSSDAIGPSCSRLMIDPAVKTRRPCEPPRGSSGPSCPRLWYPRRCRRCSKQSEETSHLRVDAEMERPYAVIDLADSSRAALHASAICSSIVCRRLRVVLGEADDILLLYPTIVTTRSLWSGRNPWSGPKGESCPKSRNHRAIAGDSGGRAHQYVGTNRRGSQPGRCARVLAPAPGRTNRQIKCALPLRARGP